MLVPVPKGCFAAVYRGRCKSPEGRGLPHAASISQPRSSRSCWPAAKRTLGKTRIRPKPARQAAPKPPVARIDLLRVRRLRSSRSSPPGLGQKQPRASGRHLASSGCKPSFTNVRFVVPSHVLSPTSHPAVKELLETPSCPKPACHPRRTQEKSSRQLSCPLSASQHPVEPSP